MQRLPCALCLGSCKRRGVTSLNTNYYGASAEISAMVNFQSSSGIAEVGSDSFYLRNLFIQ